MNSVPWGRTEWIDVLLIEKFPELRLKHIIFSPEETTERVNYVQLQCSEAALEYLAALRLIDDDELRTRAYRAVPSFIESIGGVEAYAAEIESRRFFNHSIAVADLNHWRRLAYWTADEFVALSLGLDPRVVQLSSIARFLGTSRVANEYVSRAEAVRRAVDANQVMAWSSPSVFLQWAARMQMPVSAPVAEAIRTMGEQTADWKAVADQLGEMLIEANELIEREQENASQLAHLAAEKIVQINELSDQQQEELARLENEHEAEAKALETKLVELQAELGKLRERNVQTDRNVQATKEMQLDSRTEKSLLKMIMALAYSAYRYNPQETYSSVVTDLMGDLDCLGLSLSDDTVRRHLQRAGEMLEREALEMIAEENRTK